MKLVLSFLITLGIFIGVPVAAWLFIYLTNKITFAVGFTLFVCLVFIGVWLCVYEKMGD